MGDTLSKDGKAKMEVCKNEVKEGKDIILHLPSCNVKKFHSRFLRIPKLKELGLPRNNLTEIPHQISELTELRVLDLSFNSLAILPSDLIVLPSLTHLDLSFNGILVLPEPKGGKKSAIKHLHISHNKINSLGDRFLQALTSLEVLEWGHSSLTFWPEEISKIGTLKELVLSGNKIAKMASAKGTLPRLTSLDLHENPLTQIDILAYQGSLTILNLARCKLTEWPNLQGFDIVSLDIGENFLKDPIPLWVSEWKNLEVFIINKNSIPGRTPELRKWTKLRHFDISDNQIEYVSPEIGFGAKTLRVAKLDNNKLSYLPGEFGLINPTSQLSVAGNKALQKWEVIGQKGDHFLIEALNKDFLAAMPETTQVEIKPKYYVRTPNSFHIIARDLNGENRTTGGDVFTILPSELQSELVVKDNKNGTHTVFFNMSQPVSTQFDIMLRGYKVGTFSLVVDED